MKNKKLIIGIIVAIVLIALVGVLFFMLRKENITLTFNIEKNTVYEKIVIKKGESIKLPKDNPKKDKYKFIDWTLEDGTLIDKYYTPDKDTTFYAKWLVEDVEVFTIKFDSNGGSKVNDLIVEKGKALKLPKNPTKEGYEFVTWKDKNETPISDGALLDVDKEMTLYAYWEKKEDKTTTTNNKKETFTVIFDSKGGTLVKSIVVEKGKALKLPKNPTREGYEFVTWKDKHETPISDGALLDVDKEMTLYAYWKKIKKECPTGYKLEGKSCVKYEYATPTKSCASGYHLIENACIKINSTTYKFPNQTCERRTIHTGNGHTEEMVGEVFRMGASYCFYGIVSDSYEQQNQSNCTTRGHKWNSINNKCYYYRGDALQYVKNSCDSGYTYIANPNSYPGVNGQNSGCYKNEKLNYTCPSNYTLTQVNGENKCVYKDIKPAT